MEIVLNAERKVYMMDRVITARLLAVTLLVFFTAQGRSDVPESPTYQFSGTVSRGEDFSFEFTPGLEFRLDYIDYEPGGWAVRIADPGYPDENFCSVVTPPYSGTNPLQIYAWHFLNIDGDGPNDGSVNAPGFDRSFMFVTDRDNFTLAFESLSSMLWPQTDEEYDRALAVHNTIPRQLGMLLIKDIGFVESESTSIESLEFEVELYMSAEEL